MNISNKKFTALVASVGLSTSMFLAGCSTASDHSSTTSDRSKENCLPNKKDKSCNEDQRHHSTFVPIMYSNHQDSSNGITSGKSSTGSKGIGTATRGGVGS